MRWLHEARAYLRECGRTLRDPVLALWAIYILLNPIYVFESGAPQPGDWLAVFIIPAIVFTGPIRFTRDGVRSIRPLCLFLAYVTASALVWNLLYGDWTFSLKTSFLLMPVFYLYNALFFVFSLVLYTRYRDRFLWVTVHLTMWSVFLQSVISLFYSRGVSRSWVLFNSANQLGYYAILTASVIVIGSRRLKLGTLPVVASLVACAYLSLLSASKAALASIVILALVALLTNPRMVVVSAIALLALMSFESPVSRALELTQRRFANDFSYGFAEERGYDRILLHKEYWVLGSGEGVYRRWKEKDDLIIGKHEIHSSAGTLFFCYGIAGSLLFLAFLFRVVQGARWSLILQLIPVAAFSATHQSLRFTFLWVLLAMFVVVKRGADPPPVVAEPEPEPTAAPQPLIA